MYILKFVYYYCIIFSVPPPDLISPTPQPPLLPAGPQMEFSGSDGKLRKIADDLREIVPLNAIFPSEQITFPTIGEVRFFF